MLGTEKVILDRGFGRLVSENGPREGTRDLPRHGPEAGRRAIEEASPAGVAYGSLSRALRRRRAELVGLAEAGETPTGIAKSYQSEHPLEPEVTATEVAAALRDAEARHGTPVPSRKLPRSARGKKRLTA